MSRLIREPARGTIRDRYLVKGSIAPHFVDARAVTADGAIPFTPADAREARAFAAMIADGSIRMPRAGRFYFDMDAYEAAAAARRAKRVPVMLIAALLIAAAAMVFYRA